MAKEVGVSLNPESFVEGGGLLDDVDVTIKEARFIMFDYEGKSPVAVPALKITFDPGDGELVTQCWSMGKATDWQPSKDGKKLIPIGSATAIVKTSNGGIFITSLINASFPSDRLADGDISCIEGLEAHVIRTPAPERTGIEGQKKNATILIIDKIIALPGENKKKSGKATKAGKAASSGAVIHSSSAEPIRTTNLCSAPARKARSSRISLPSPISKSCPWSQRGSGSGSGPGTSPLGVGSSSRCRSPPTAASRRSKSINDSTIGGTSTGAEPPPKTGP